jgi:hypothetical protein
LGSTEPAMSTQENKVIECEWKAGRSDEAVVRRLYSVELPFAFEGERDRFFRIVEDCSEALQISVFDIKVAGSAQTGYSFHNAKPFARRQSDLDLAIINPNFYEKLLRAAQKAALPDADSLERPRQNVFPVLNGHNTYDRFVENATMYGFILPHYLPKCDEREKVYQVARRLSSSHSDLFKNVNLAFYISQYFFERKQRPNLGIYRRRKEGDE